MPKNLKPAKPPAGSLTADQPDTVDILVINEAPLWIQPFLAYLINDKILKDELAARQIKRRARLTPPSTMSYTSAASQASSSAA